VRERGEERKSGMKEREKDRGSEREIEIEKDRGGERETKRKKREKRK